MPTPPKTNHMKFTLWTENGLRMDVPGGTISACVIMAFESIGPGKVRTAAESRALALKLMTDAHNKLVEEGR